MAENISKTARASMVSDRVTAHFHRPCPTCGTSMVATKVIRSAERPGGMYWICPKDDVRQKI